MYALDQLVHAPRVFEIDSVEIAAPPARVWEAIRHGELLHGSLLQAFVAGGELAQPVAAGQGLCLDDLVCTPEHPGLSLFVEYPGFELALGAVVREWQAPFECRYVADGAAFAAFSEAGFIKVALGLSVSELSYESTCLSCELRVDATDSERWELFDARFQLLGPALRFLRQSALAALARQLGRTREHERRSLPGDELLPDAAAEVDHEISIKAPPAAIWPSLVQLACGRAGFYSLDLLDDAGARSVREPHPEWQALRVGDVIAIAPDQGAHFEVLRVDSERALVLGGLFDTQAQLRLGFAAARPSQYWQVTWAFVLEPHVDGVTSVRVRARAAWSGEGLLHASWMRPVHYVLDNAQLHQLRARAEQNPGRDDSHDVIEGLGGAARIALELLTPFAARRQTCWGMEPAEAARKFPGDELVRDPRWGWTHAIEVHASAERVWPWIAQIGAKHGGFYSYQWLENLVGCDVRNAEAIHPEWLVELGDEFYVHPSMPPLRIAAIEVGRWFVAYASSSAHRDPHRPWVSLSWLFLVEPRGDQRCRVVSRYRVAYSDDIRSRLSFGQTLLRPVGYAMDRRMLEGIRERAERSASR